MPQKEVEDALRCIALHSVKILFRLSHCALSTTKHDEIIISREILVSVSFLSVSPV